MGLSSDIGVCMCVCVCVCVCVVETLHAGEDFFSQNSIPNPGI